jgi:hypothetical protein
MGFPLKPKWNPLIDFTNGEHVSVGTLLDRGVFTKDWFDSCFKFAFVRNPWDRLVSVWAHLKGYRLNQKRQRDSNSFLSDFRLFAYSVCDVDSDFVRPVGKLVTDDWSQANPQVEWLRWGVDFVGRYENLDEDWIALCTVLGIPLVILSRENNSSRKSGYQQYYDDELRDLVGEYYREDIERWGYVF